MAFSQSGGNFNDLLGSLSALRRRGKLTNQNITSNDVLNVQEPYFYANRLNAPSVNANRQYEEQLAEQKRQYDEQSQFQQEQAEDASMMGTVQTGISGLGTAMALKNLLSSPKAPAVAGAEEAPGIVSKGITGIKNLAGKVGNLITGTPEAAPELLNTTGTLAAGEGAAAAGGEVATDIATQAAMDAGIDTVTPGIMAAGESAPGLLSSAGNALSGVGGALSIAAPYYALAKMGGMAINAITDNNPWMKDTPLGLLGETLEEPLAVEQALGKALARHGIGNESMWEGFNNANPLEVGGWLTDTDDKLRGVLTGGVSGAKEFMHGLGQEFGIRKEDADVASNVLTGGMASIGDIGKGSKATRNALANIGTLGLYSLVKKACIIVTACTSPDSEEVEITREYRDKFLTPEQLRGYYVIAEKIVPMIENSGIIKRFIKKILVDNLIEYGRFALGKTMVKPGILSKLITILFLGLCKAVGYTRKSFVRSNGEVF